MILYHYTSHLYLPIIQEERLSLGRVPISLSERQNAVWLTSDMIGRDHRLGPDPETCEQLSRQTGRVVCMANKLAVRIRVKIPPNDQRLVYWPKWAKKRLAPYFYDAVGPCCTDQSLGGEDWTVYQGPVSDPGQPPCHSKRTKIAVITSRSSGTEGRIGPPMTSRCASAGV